MIDGAGGSCVFGVPGYMRLHHGDRSFGVLTCFSADTSGGPGRSCRLILSAFAEQGIPTKLVAPRVRSELHPAVEAQSSLPAPVRPLPWRAVAPLGRHLRDKQFMRAMEQADPADTLLYVWPGAPLDLLERGRALGFKMVREMINNPCVVAKDILDAAFSKRGLGPYERISRAHADYEQEELRFYDLIFASNREVDANLASIGIPANRIAQVAFGWAEDAGWRAPVYRADRARPVFLYLGTLEVRKGLLELLEAWADLNPEAELVLAGRASPEIAPALKQALASGTVRHVGFVRDVAALLADADAFVLPTWEEGGPQVTVEAARAGLPIVTTSMGAARLVEDGKTGLIVPPGDPAALAAAMGRLIADPALRETLGRAAYARSPAFSYAAVAGLRVDAMARMFSARAA